MVQLCAAIWSNILKGRQRGAGASTGKGNQVVIGNQISQREEPLIQNFAFMLHCPLCAQDSAWHQEKARPSLAASDACAEPLLKGRACSSVLSTQHGLFTGLHFPLYPCSHTLPLFIHPNPKFVFFINCHIGSPCKRAVAAPGGQGLFIPGCS